MDGNAKRYELIIFDMDGTFIESKAFHVKTFRRFISSYIRPVSYEETEKMMGDTLRSVFESVGVSEADMPEIYHRFVEFCECNIDDLIREIPVVDGIYEVLDKVKRSGIHCALLTNTVECVTKKILECHGFTAFFDMVSGADMYSLDKTGRCIQMIDSFHVTRDNTLCVGDSEFDFQMSNKVGCDSCFARTSSAWYKDESYILNELNPTYTVGSLREIVTVLQL